MNLSSSFAPGDLRAIKRTFYTRTATPNEVCLELRPRKRCWHLVMTGLFEAVMVTTAVGILMAPKMLGRHELGDVLETEFWATCLFIGCGFLLVFVLLPDACLPRFELVLRSDSNHVLLRGFGVEQRAHGGCCSVGNRYLWCNFYVDGVRYALVRRWWQLPLPVLRGASALRGPLTRAKALLDSVRSSAEGRQELRRSADRRLYVKVFGEALFSDSEAVLVLPPAAWYIWIGMVGCALVGCMAIIFGHAFYSPIGYYTVGDHFVPYVKWMPMWLPTAILLLCTAIAAYWADPWFRRAVLVLPKGEQSIRVQVGGRTVGEGSFGAYTICLDDDEGSYFFMNTRYWSGSKSTAFREGACSDAIERLHIWTGLVHPPEASDG
jgi:hypothetical protein